MSNEWGHGDDDEMARLLKRALREEADRVEVPHRLDEIRTAAFRSQPRRTPWLYAVAAALVLVVGVGLVWQLGLLSPSSSTMAAAPASADQRGAPESARTRSDVAPPPSAASVSTPRAPSSTSAGTSGPTPSPAARSITAASVAFAAPSGNIVCHMTGTEVACQVMSATDWERAAPRSCPVIGGGTMPFAYNQGAISLTAKGASLYCGGQALMAAALETKDPATGWYQAGRDQTVATAYGTVPVLPYGGVATTPNGQSCRVDESGVTCADRSGAAFHVARESLTMTTASSPTPTVVRYLTTAQASAFVTPTGRLTCLLSGDGASCEVAERTYTPPAKPASCQLDWGSRIGVDLSRVGFVCAGDTIRQLPSDPAYTAWYDTRWAPQAAPGTLGYGSTLTVGSYTCAVETTGVTCTQKDTNRGFVIASGSYRLLP